MFALIIVSMSVNSEIVVTDDNDNVLIFKQPVERIVSLAPHVTELLFAAGADKQILGTVSFSNYPEAAKKVSLIGNYDKIDYEKILSLQPQLVIYWGSGNPASMINGVKNLKIKTFNSEPKSFEDVAVTIRELGKLLGTEQIAEKRVQLYLQRLSQLRKKYANNKKKKIRVFYQVWNRPLMTINQKHLISEVIEFCGGINVFAELDSVAPTVDIESVIQKNPDVIIAGMAEGREDWLSSWKNWSSIAAVKHNHLYGIDADLIARHTPRILQGTELMCDALNKVRNF